MRKSWVVNGALLALGFGSLGVVWATRDAPTSAERAERKDKLLPKFQREDVKRVRLSRGKDELVLERSADELRIVKPWAERADIATTQKLLGALELASALRPADVSREQSGLGDSALLITIEASGTPLKLRLGGPAPAPAGARYAEVEADGKRQTYVVSQGMATELDVPFDKFRETRLLEYGRSELAKLTLRNESGEIQLEQREHAAFFVRTGDAWQLARREAVEAVLTALARLASEQLVEAGAARAALGNKPTELGLELFDKSAPPVSVRFAPTCPAAPDQALVLIEQAGKSPRSGCIPSEVLGALGLTSEDARLRGPFSARVDEVEELKLSRGAEKLNLARKDRDFVLRGSTNSDVPLDAGNQRIAALLNVKGTPSAATFEPLGEATIQIAGSDEAAHREERVSYGKARGDGSLCFKRFADGVTLCVDAEAARAFEPDTTLLRSLAVWSFAASDVRSFRIEGKELREQVVRRDDGTYQLEEPKGFQHDGALVANVVQTLGALQAARWVSAGDEPRFGFGEPRLRVSVALTDGKPARELVVGAAAPGGYFAKLATEPGVFVLPGLAFADLSTPLVDRSLAPFAESELTSVELQSGQEKPRALSGTLLASVASLRAEQTVHLGPAQSLEGLSRPRLRLSLNAKSGQSARLDVGNCDTLNDAAICYARLSGVDATFAISRRLVAELLDFSQDAH